MIYYPLSTLMLAGVNNILIITTMQDQKAFQNLLGDGSDFGISLSYEVQEKPEGLAQAFIIGESFLDGEDVIMILGDNIYHGVGLGSDLKNVIRNNGAHIFTYEVSNPSAYGILEVDEHNAPISIEEKPLKPKSNLAVTGLYYFDSEVVKNAKNVIPSNRGELEITSLIQIYLQNGELTVTQLSRGTAWLDTGNPDAMHDASSFVRVIEERTGLKIGCPEEISFRNGWISAERLFKRGKALGSSAYGKYLLSIK